MLSAPDMTGIKAVLFDLGGTLVHPTIEPSWEIYEIFKAKLEKDDPILNFDDFKKMIHHYWVEMQDEYYSSKKDIPIGEYNSHFLKEWGYLEESSARLGNFFSDLIFEYELETTELIPGARELLDWLKIGGIPTGLITNASHTEERMHRLLRKVEIEDCFDVILVSSAVGIRKPNPGIFLKALSILNIKPGESVYIGDRFDYDALGAQNAGMRWILRDDETSLASVLQILKNAI